MKIYPDKNSSYWALTYKGSYMNWKYEKRLFFDQRRRERGTGLDAYSGDLYYSGKIEEENILKNDQIGSPFDDDPHYFYRFHIAYKYKFKFSFSSLFYWPKYYDNVLIL